MHQLPTLIFWLQDNNKPQNHPVAAKICCTRDIHVLPKEGFMLIQGLILTARNSVQAEEVLFQREDPVWQLPLSHIHTHTSGVPNFPYGLKAPLFWTIRRTTKKVKLTYFVLDIHTKGYVRKFEDLLPFLALPFPLATTTCKEIKSQWHCNVVITDI